MNFTLKYSILAFMVVAALLTGSTAAAAVADKSNQLRGAEYLGKGIGRQLGAVFTPAVSDRLASGSIPGSNTGSTYTPPPPECPVQITLNSRQGAKHASNGKCPAIAIGGYCTYDQDKKNYAQCDCLEVSRNKSEWQCYPNP
eukprot:CAMPEP_0170881204 /NCGR_PEP_ID=MMETSP0734-20130129/32911_1 /TAXON_ID=186038 /ORGANISM="Fragilariopsis kerguelensis, Strain L26-C5" /LENGTH=141 /DNA_ID=CAMNT_0011264913 /DNA_START=62 /DNA_END=487 /DNA_ORIENTATION=-